MTIDCLRPVDRLCPSLLGIDTENGLDVSSLARRDMHVETVGLDRECLLDLELIVGVMGSDIKVLEDLHDQQSSQYSKDMTHHGNDQKSLLPGEWPADASSDTITEWLPAVRGQVLEPAIQHSLRPTRQSRIIAGAYKVLA